MIKLFGTTDKEYSTNGDLVIIPLKAIIHKADNGDFYLDLETDLKYSDFLTENRILSAPTPQGEQAFRVGNVSKTRKKLTTRAYHVFYDSKNYLIESSYVTNKNCNDALDQLNRSTSDTSPFTTLSDIPTIANYHCIRRSLYEAIETILERWGGHLVRDNWAIAIRDTIGTDNGVVIRYAKNLKEISSEENWDEVVTKLLPVGKDGILLNALDPTADLYVYSTESYTVPYTKKVSFNQDAIEEKDYVGLSGEVDQMAYTEALLLDLKHQAQAYVDAHSVPKINYTLKANVEKLTDIGDTIEVIDERLGINLFTNVISYEYDCILKKYTEIEFGNFKKELSGLVPNILSEASKEIEAKSESAKVILGRELKKSTDEIWGRLGSSYVIYEGDKILVVDRLPKEEAENVLMISNGGIGFSNSGINGTFNSAWTLDGTLNMQAINIINLTADLIKGGTLKLGSNLDISGQLEVYDEANRLIAELNKSGLKIFGPSRSYILLNDEVGLSGYDRENNRIYWCDSNEFHMARGVVTESLNLFDKFICAPFTIRDNNNLIISDGIGIVPAPSV